MQLILTMFRNAFQHRFVTVFSSAGSKPLAIWDVHTKNGHSRRVTDEDIRSLAFELIGVNVATTYMVAPCAPCPSLSIKLPFLVMLVKNMKKFFCFEVQVRWFFSFFSDVFRQNMIIVPLLPRSWMIDNRYVGYAFPTIRVERAWIISAPACPYR